MKRKKITVKSDQAKENTRDNCTGSSAVGETGPSTVKKIKDFLHSLDGERWGTLLQDARSFSADQMHLPSLRAGAALDHLTDQQHEDVVQYVREKCDEALGVPAAVNLLFLVVSMLVLEKKILLTQHPEELQRKSSDAMRKLVESLTDLNKQAKRAPLVELPSGRLQITKPSNKIKPCHSHEMPEKPGLKLVLNLKGASTPTSEPGSDVYHEEKRHKHKKKKKKKSSDREKHRHHESRKRDRDVSESELTAGSDLAEPPLKRKAVEAMLEGNPLVEDVSDKKGREPRACTIHEDEPSVLRMCLDYLHKQLIRKDVHGIFAYPVNDVIAPGYSSIIQEPMDFGTMGCKVDDDDYSSVTEYKRDFVLMCNNAMTYNRPETIFYKEAKKLLQSGLRVLNKEKLLFYKRSLSFMSNITMEELGLDPMGEELSTSLDVATEQVVERERRLAREKKKKPKQNKFEAIPDNLTAEEILEQAEAAAKGAAGRLAMRQPDSSVGFLRRRDDGSTTFNMLNPDNDGIVSETERIVSLGELIGKLNSGTGSIAGFKEDKRNRIIPVNYLNYGPFSSFAPTYDSSFANITKEESDLVLSTYGDDTGVQYARSVLNFVENAGSFAVKMVDEILDNLTKGEHSKAQRLQDQKKRDGTENKDGSEKSESQKKKKKSKSGKSPRPETVDPKAVRSLAELGVDVSFLDTFENEQKEKRIQETQQKLDQTAELIQNLQKSQHERLSQKPPLHLAHAPPPSDRELKLADKVCQELKELAKEVTPGSVSSVKSLRHVMGVSIHPPVTQGGGTGQSGDIQSQPMTQLYQDSQSQGATQLSQDDPMTADIDQELREFLDNGPGLKDSDSPDLESGMDINDSPLAPLPLS